MLLQKLRCFHFKNYAAIELNFATQLNCIIGPNGAGKTNLLDAIHYLCLTKSAFNTVDNQNILHKQMQMAIQGHFLKVGKSYDIKCIVQREQGKTLEVNGKTYEKFRDHVGQFPLVFTTPYDTELIQGGSEGRRRFFDAILCQLDTNYLSTLVQYQQTLKQKNSLLKLYAGNGSVDRALIDAYDQQLLPLNKQIYSARKAFLAVFCPLFEQHYQYFVDAPEKVSLAYESDVSKPEFIQLYLDNFYQDLVLQRTVLGIHTDDFVFTLNGYPLKKFSSQGQQKSFIIALRLAQFTCMHQVLGCKPLLLLDDIFDKLDEQRIERLVHLMTQQYFGQVWITDAGSVRSTGIIKKYKQIRLYSELIMEDL
jgi:DNA replication and repair protein RecF